MTLRELLADAAGQLDGIATDLEPDGTVTWSRAGRLFASVDPGGVVAEFALDPAVAAAAARTPDVRLSGIWDAIGPDQQRFMEADLAAEAVKPGELDDYGQPVQRFGPMAR